MISERGKDRELSVFWMGDVASALSEIKQSKEDSQRKAKGLGRTQKKSRRLHDVYTKRP